MTHWFKQLFGDAASFGVDVGFEVDPHSNGKADDLVSSWGSLEVWVDGRCLTRFSADHGLGDAVQWTLLPFLEWLAENLIALLNEEPLPLSVAADEVRDAADWLLASERPVATLSDLEEDSWFERRDRWRRRHALRQGFLDAAFPQILMRRCGSRVELSWDNLRWATPRRGLAFAEQRGTRYVDLDLAARVLRSALVESAGRLADRAPSDRTASLLKAANGLRAGPDTWRGLIHPETGAALVERFPECAARLGDLSGVDLVVPHRLETLVLRHLRSVAEDEIGAILASLDLSTNQDGTGALDDLREAELPNPESPWEDGYERALSVRRRLGLDDRCPADASQHLSALGAVTHSADVSGADLIVVRRGAPRVLTNPGARARRRETGAATALGHLLMDFEEASVDGTFEHWPTSARARAFGAMFLMPEQGVRAVISTTPSPSPVERVARVMKHYGTGLTSTAWHLRNLRIMSEDEHEEVLLHR